MAPTPTRLTFTSWNRRRVFAHATPTLPRLTGNVSLTMTDTSTGQQQPGVTPFTFAAAADILSISPAAIKHVAPAPMVTDAEVTKFVHIDFWEEDFPWRYSPEVQGGDRLHPWLVLLVGTPQQIEVVGNLVTIHSNDVLKTSDIVNNSPLWAHMQEVEGRTISRLISASTLPPKSECVAVVVPAFNNGGLPNWEVAANGTVTTAFTPAGVLPALYSWRFWTEVAGDFTSLVEALRIPKAGLTGISSLHYERKTPDQPSPVTATLQIRGAITSQKLPEPDPDEITEVNADLDALNDALTEMHAISMPQYGRPWLVAPGDILSGWPETLNNDPRNRGIAGLGTWMGVEAQESLMDAAVAQAGALREAGQHINYLALGLHAAGRLWDRRLPTSKKQRLHVFGPMMNRMVADTGQRAVDAVTGGASPFPPAFFSGAAQCVLRARSAHTRHLINGALDRELATEQVNQADPVPQRAPAGLPHIDTIAVSLGLVDGDGNPLTIDTLLGLDRAFVRAVTKSLTELLEAFAAKFDAERKYLIEHALEAQIPARRAEIAQECFDEFSALLDAALQSQGIENCRAGSILESLSQEIPNIFSGFFERLLVDPFARQLLLERVESRILRCMSEERCRELSWPQERPDALGTCEILIGLSPDAPPSRHQPTNPDGISDAIVGLIDPRQPNPPAKVRLCSRLQGVDCTELIRPEFPIGIDYPTWDLLRQYEKEWLLPGARSLPSDSVVALQTNPAFIDSFMVGINSQFMSEMRWRDLPVDRTCTPLRMFWGQVDYTTHRRMADIEPLAEWAKSPEEPIGSLAHQTIQPADDNASGSRLVIVFRTDLFRRYPATLVYLIRPPAGANIDALILQTPELDMPAELTLPAQIDNWRKTRQFLGPVFSGKITPELTFFTFDVKPDDIDDYWLILDEPPSELRFKRKPTVVSVNAAEFAAEMIDQPTRVAISGAELKAQGLA